MNQQKFIGQKCIKDITKETGFGNKTYYMYTNPRTQSVIQLDDDQIWEYEEYREQNQPNRPNPTSDSLNIGFAFSKNKPINITKQQMKIQQKIVRGDDKVSTISTPSQIYQSHTLSKCWECINKQCDLQELKQLNAKLKQQFQNQIKERTKVSDSITSQLRIKNKELEQEVTRYKRMMQQYQKQKSDLSSQIQILKERESEQKNKNKRSKLKSKIFASQDSKQKTESNSKIKYPFSKLKQKNMSLINDFKEKIWNSFEQSSENGQINKLQSSLLILDQFAQDLSSQFQQMCAIIDYEQLNGA